GAGLHPEGTFPGLGEQVGGHRPVPALAAAVEGQAAPVVHAECEGHSHPSWYKCLSGISIPSPGQNGKVFLGRSLLTGEDRAGMLKKTEPVCSTALPRCVYRGRETQR